MSVYGRIREAKRLYCRELDLSDCRLAVLPQEVFNLHKLEVLDLRGNFLSSLPPEIGRLTNLKYLYLSGNMLKTLPAEIGQLSNLKRLYARKNNLESIPPELGRLDKLQELDISHNQVTALPDELAGLSSLQELYVSENDIGTLNPCLGTLTNLVRLDLSKNRLTSIPSYIAHMANLQEMYLDENPIETPPPEIVAQGINAVRSFFSSFHGEEVHRLYEAKLVIVGQGDVGKTCIAENIVNSSKGIDIKGLGTTRGVSIKGWKWPYGDNIFKTNIWDFGGQEIYHATHQMFLTKRSLYILVWEARKDEKNIESFDYWLNAVSLLSKKSPIIMVLNKIDERTVEIDETLIKSTFDNIVAFHKVSCKTGKGISDLLSTIKETIVKLPLVGTDWPRAWSQVREILEKDSRNYISYNEYMEVCSRHMLNQDQANLLSTYLHDLGIILHFQDDIVLRNIVILKPEWGTDAVYKVLDVPEIQENKGRFKLGDLRFIWGNYPGDKHTELLQLMKRFEICFELPGSDEYIIPGLLAGKRPEFEWDCGNNLKLDYEYKFMPAGILTRFIVRNHRLIENEYYWRHGVRLVFENNTRALIISKPFDRKICVQVQGPEAKEFLAIIRNELNYINNTLNKPPVNEVIPCICKRCMMESPHYYSYKKLKGMWLNNIKSIRCEDDPYEEVSIGELLSGYEKKEEMDIDYKNYHEHKYYYGNYFEGSEVIMARDVYKANQVGNMGPGGRIENVNFNNFQNGLNQTDMKALIEDLAKVREAMMPEAKTTEQLIELGKVAEAEEAAKEGNHKKLFEALKSTGKWTATVAGSIAAQVAANAIKQAFGAPSS